MSTTFQKQEETYIKIQNFFFFKNIFLMLLSKTNNNTQQNKSISLTTTTIHTFKKSIQQHKRVSPTLYTKK